MFRNNLTILWLNSLGMMTKPPSPINEKCPNKLFNKKFVILQTPSHFWTMSKYQEFFLKASLMNINHSFLSFPIT